MRFRVALVVAGLGLVLVGLLFEFRRAMRGSRRAAEAPPPTEADEVEPVAAPPPSPETRRSFAGARSERRPARTGAGHLHGRVVRPASAAQGGRLHALRVTAAGGRRQMLARIGPDEDRFALHLPPGRYTLTAHADGFIGFEPGVLVAAGTDREVTIRLEPAVTVSGRVHQPGQDRSASLHALRAGGDSEIDAGGGEEGEIDGETFSIDGLRDGQAYDLVFSGARLRTTTLRGVVAPAEGLDVALARLPVLHGAVGFARGEHCPIHSVTLSTPGDDLLSADEDEEADGASVDSQCRFELAIPEELSRPEQVSRFKVVAVGVGWYLEESIAVPSQGDPDFLCLNPPCRTDGPEEEAQLRVTLDAASAGAGNGWIRVVAGSQGCAGTGATCEVSQLPVGEPIEIEVEASGSSCQDQSRTMVLSAGQNVLEVPCVPRRIDRRVQGYLRTAAGGAPERLVVRCAGGGQQLIRETLVFSMRCPRDVSTLEYQLASDGLWTAVPIPDERDPALVEIAIGRL